MRSPSGSPRFMSDTVLQEPWRSLALEWVPRLLACWSVEGLETPAGNVRLLGPPDGISLINGAVCVSFGPVVFQTRHPLAVAYMNGEAVRLGGQTVSFPEPVPNVAGIPDGLQITWPTPGVVHGLLARAAGVRLLGARVYSRSAIISLQNSPDRVLRW